MHLQEKEDWEFLESTVYGAEMTGTKLGPLTIPSAAASIVHHMLGNSI